MRRLLTVVMIVAATQVQARDFGQWDGELAKWFQSLRQPDAQNAPCCGEADAYWADSFEVTPAGEYVAILTDERDVQNRVPRPPGTKFVIPKQKIMSGKDGNPTGHGIVFLSPTSNMVYCYLPPGGV